MTIADGIYRWRLASKAFVALDRLRGLAHSAGRTKLPLLAAAAIGGVAGCTVGPDFHRPAPPPADALPVVALNPENTPLPDGQTGQKFLVGAEIPGQWWELFHSKELNRLVEEALRVNPDVAAAQAALRVAQENVAVQRGQAAPTLDASFNPTRQRIANVLATPLSAGQYTYNLHTAQVNVGYVPDIFGGNRRAVESLDAQADAQRYQLQATLLTLTANVVNTALQEASLRQQIVVTEELVKLQSHVLDLFRRQLELGQIAAANLAPQEAALAQTEATIPALRKQLAQQQDALAALTGRFPNAAGQEALAIESLSLPESLPVSLPGRLVEQRPDILIAEAQLRAASAQIGVAVANRLPNITLTASVGSAATELRNLFSGPTTFYNLGATVAQPLFHGQSLLHRQRAAEAAYEQSMNQYRSAVYTAFQNVADVLNAVKNDSDALAAAIRSEDAAAKSLHFANRQLELGDISTLVLINAQQAYQQAVINRLLAQTNRYSDTAALFQALGGGWWNRPASSN